MAGDLTIKVQVKGFDALAKKLEGAEASTFGVPVRHFFKESAKVLWSEVFKRTPRRTGNLQQHLFSHVDASQMPKWARVGFQPLKYAPYVEFGTGIYSIYPGAKLQPITPVTKKALAWKGPDGKMIVRKSVKGMHPRQMLALGWVASVPKIEALLKVCAKEIQQLWQQS